MDYIARLVLVYSLAFFLAYHGMTVYNKIKKSSVLLNNFLGGLIFSAVLAIVIIIVSLADFHQMPYSRFLLVGFATFYFGPISGILSAIICSILDYSFQHTDILQHGLMQACNILLYYSASVLMKKLRRNPRVHEIILGIFIINAVEAFIAHLLVFDKAFYWINLNNFYLIAPMEALMATALLSISYHNKERQDLILHLETNSIQLTEQKQQIKELYEEVSANEEELRNNYNELSKYEERIEYLAFHENQTGFLNGEKLMERLREQRNASSERGGSMLIIGIEGVDKLEHTIGIVLMDTLHYLVGIEVMSVFEKLSGGQIYSMAKGKYAVVADSDVEEDQLHTVYSDLRKRFMQSFVINTIELKVNVAAGGLHFSEEAEEPEQWIEQCEFAFYQASQSEQSEPEIVWFGKSLMEKHARKLQIEKELYKAIEKNELYLVYQAQYNNDRKLIGAEALLRWRHPELGEIPPVSFIPIAEKNGLIDSIGKVVIQNVSNLMDRHRDLLWNSMNQIPLSVNASFLELINPYFTERFMEILNKNNVSCDQINVEITESEVSKNYKELSENLSLLSEAGIKVELDDFGTGYSSLNHLGSMPIHTIKIDKCFIDKILLDDKIGDLVELIIIFAHRFKMRVIAEGVETEEQFLWLRDKQCDAYQGYYFAKPMMEALFLEQVQKNIQSL